MLPNVGWPELIVILIVAMLIFGPQRLAEVGGAMGKAIREFRKSVREGEDEPKPPTSSGS
jgi:sec-independent protein translocase protein TatA